jgi:hypothetical protein
MLMAYVAMLYTEGMWSNAIRLINVVTAALLATNFFEPVAQWLDDWDHARSYVWDFLTLWGLFAALMMLFRLATDQISQVKVRFLEVVDKVGSAFFAIWVGWVMICFMMMTLHTAPLARNFLFGGFQPEQRMFLGLAPDRQWLGFMRKMSLGPFCRWASEEELQQKYVFDPHAEFLPKYTARRTKLQANVAANDSICEPSSP